MTRSKRERASSVMRSSVKASASRSLPLFAAKVVERQDGDRGAVDYGRALGLDWAATRVPPPATGAHDSDQDESRGDSASHPDCQMGRRMGGPLPSRTTRQASTLSARFLTRCRPIDAKRDLQSIARLLVDRARDADPSWLGQLLKPGGQVDALTEDVVVLIDHVAKADPDAELDAIAGRRSCSGRAPPAALPPLPAPLPRRWGTRPGRRRPSA